MRVLHLEDETVDSFLIRHTLEQAGFYDITQIASVHEFRQALDRGGFDVVLSDNRVAALTGTQALALARGRWPGIPFIVLSGADDERLKEMLLQAGATACFWKDQLTDLVTALRELASKTAAQAD